MKFDNTIQIGVLVSAILSILGFAFFLGRISERLELLSPEKVEAAQKEAISNINNAVIQAGASLNEAHPISIDLGGLPTGNSKSRVVEVSRSIPETATSLRIYMYIETGGKNSHGSREFHVAVNTPTGEYFTPLRVHAYQQSAWSYSSEVDWLPMPQDKKITIRRASGLPIGGNQSSSVKIIGYR